MSIQSQTKDFVTPGQRLGLASEYRAGQGTYIKDNHVYAAVIGFKKVIPHSEKNIIQITRQREQSSIPTIDAIVMGKVRRITTRTAHVAIMAVGNVPVKENFEGIIRIQDVRATERDKVQISKSFRPGDIIRAQVISLGESASYLLSTARNDLGVIFAQSQAGATMIPISWQEMQCPQTGVIEYRKVCRLEG
ncbi:hypothetical protein BKA69DRAFT_1048559 [Paraphysoderma sedebokerense]|nr:hypothetical protein BKA69DRAFT_1048559 [Paraphysoderma sedebokerense]